MKKIEIHHSEEFRDVISKFPTKFNTILALSLFFILLILETVSQLLKLISLD